MNTQHERIQQQQELIEKFRANISALQNSNSVREARITELEQALVGILKVANVRIDDPRIEVFDTAREVLAKPWGVQS